MCRLTLPRPGLLGLVLSLALGACSTVPPSNVRANAKLTPTTQITRDLTRLPRPAVKVPVAVYGFRDQTGQFKAGPDSAYSTLVTQGAASILVKALEDSGWYMPVEREGLQNLLTERRIVRAIESPTDKGKPVVNLPNMTPASLIIEGGVIAYESNVRTGGKGASYLGIGSSTQYRVDQVTVGLRAVDVRTGQVVGTVSVTKTIYSTQFTANVYKYIAYQALLQAETGYTRNEPAQLAVREAVESAVLHLTAFGIRDRYLELQDPGEWDHPVVQAALAEALMNIGEALPEDGVPIPLRPMLADCDAVIRPLVAADPAVNAAPNRAAGARTGATRAARPQPCLGPVTSGDAPAAEPARVAPSTKPLAPSASAGPAMGQAAAPGAPVAAPLQTVPATATPPAAVRPVPKAEAVPAPVAQGGARSAAPPPAERPAPTPAPAPAPAPASVPVPAIAAAAAAAKRAGPASAPAANDDIFNQYWKSR